MALDHISNSSSSPSLPFDVFGVVIDILASERSSNPYFSLKNLMALSFTCHDLLLLCQPYTFRTVNLRAIHLRKVTGKAFYEIPTIGLQEMGLALKRNPRVASYVRNLNLQLSPSDVTGDDLVDILRQFTRLQKLALTPPENPNYIQGVQHWWADGDEDLDGEGDLGLIEFNGGTYVERYEQRKFNWWGLSPKLQNTLRGLIHLPKLTTLKLLLVIGFPTDILAIATNLQTFHVNRCEFEAGSPVEPVASAGIQLQQIKLRPGSLSNIQMLKGQAFLGAPPVLDLSWTRNFFFIFSEFRDFGNNIAELAAILLNMSHLETLTLFYRYWWPSFMDTGPFPEQTFRGLTNLRNLKILWDTPISMYYDGILTATLQEATTLKLLENIDIRIKLYPGYIEPVVKDLKYLDNHLSDPSKFPALTSVSIAIFLDHSRSKDSVLQSLSLPPSGQRESYKPSSIRLLLDPTETPLPSLSSSSTVRLEYSVMDAVGATKPTIIVGYPSGIRNTAYTDLVD